MHISNIKFTEFRLFRNVDIKLGRHITAIAGHNASGKSTVLAFLGHCGELKSQKTMLKKPYRSDLKDILRFSSPYDKVIPNAATISFVDVGTTGIPEKLSYRTTWQKDRYRIIPKKTPEKNNEKKIEWPTLYLGLSRLYPLGESNAEGISKLNIERQLNPEDKAYFISSYNRILPSFDTVINVEAVAIKETNKKKSIGVSTNRYDYMCNSAGQDNVGQIILSIISYKKLKAQLDTDWAGGLLLIDEIDATLHPSAQDKLLDYLLEASREIGIQVVFTTHSLSLLEKLSIITRNNNPEAINSCEVSYLTTANRSLQVISNPSYETIYHDMSETYENIRAFHRQLQIYTEDNEAIWFSKYLLGEVQHKIKYIDVDFSCSQLLKMNASDYMFFSQFIFILDGDVSDTDITVHANKTPQRKFENLLKLPGAERPESVIYNYIENLPDNHPFLVANLQHGYSLRNIIDNGPNSATYTSNPQLKDRDRYKKWFNDNLPLVDLVMPFWIQDHPTEVEDFRRKFVKIYNRCARIHGFFSISYDRIWQTPN